MQIAITRLAEKGTKDQALCEKYGHSARIVSPLQAELNASLVQTFVLAANDGEFDAIFFTSAYPAKHIGLLLNREITKRCRVIAIGPQTAKILHEQGVAAETLPTFYSRDFVPYLGNWIEGKRIGIPRADVPNPELIRAIEDAGGLAFEYRCYGLVPTGEFLDLEGVDVVLFTSANSFSQARLPDLTRIIPAAIGEITAERMKEGGVTPIVVGDGSLEGTLIALNGYLKKQ
ncbi:uroporphyrinogen-III synthase [Methanocorpusculum labreanum]|nr:uroporphyrinogen-III synthase [Methanocorpusculum labreanum]